MPISATMIRENPFKYREYISDVVYKGLITKMVFVGAMSTGKSTITEALAKKYKMTYASEVGDIIGSVFERHNIKSKSFELFSSNSRYTDDSVLTIATMDSIINKKTFYESYRYWFRML